MVIHLNKKQLDELNNGFSAVIEQGEACSTAVVIRPPEFYHQVVKVSKEKNLLGWIAERREHD